MSGEPVIVGVEISAGHDGSAELVVRLRYPNGVEGALALDEETGLALMRNSGATQIEELVGKSWRAIVGKG